MLKEITTVIQKIASRSYSSGWDDALKFKGTYATVEDYKKRQEGADAQADFEIKKLLGLDT